MAAGDFQTQQQGGKHAWNGTAQFSSLSTKHDSRPRATQQGGPRYTAGGRAAIRFKPTPAYNLNVKLGAAPVAALGIVAEDMIRRDL